MGGGTVSVIVPVYKIKPEYLRKSVESILTQTYTDLEVILVDDGSPDSCGAICDEYAVADARVSVVHRENGGASVARNTGMAKATGEYLAFVDGDDYLVADYIEQLLEALPPSAQIISCCCTVIGEDFTDEDHFFEGDRVFSDKPTDVDEGYIHCPKEELFCQLMQNSYSQPQRAYTAIGVPWGKLYRTALLKENGFRFASGQKMMEDNVLNMYAYNAADEIIYVDRPLYNYRIEHISGWMLELGDEYADVCLITAKARVKALQETGLDENPRLQSFCDVEIAQFLINTLNNVVFKPGEASTEQKHERANQLVDTYPFDEVVARRPKLPGKKRRLCMFLAVNRMWRTYEVLSFARNIKRKIFVSQ